MPTQTVQHPIHGPGIVIAERYSGFELKVRFADGRERYVRADQVQVEAISDTKGAPPPTTIQAARKPPTPSRSIIEMLRMGIVPENRVQDFTFGREAELTQLHEWLFASDDGDGARIILGAYGTGKTHMLNYLRSDAMKQGYAVAFVEMDAQEAPFSRPKRVYAQLVQSLRYRDAATGREVGFRDLVQRAVYAGLTHEHPYFAYLTKNLADENVWNWILARENTPRPYDAQNRYWGVPGLYNHGTAANLYTNLLSGLGWFCQHPKIGLKGLLLIFDESETLFSYQTRSSTDKSFNFLDALLAVADNNPTMLSRAANTAYTSSAHAGHIPFLYRPTSGLKLALAFTGITPRLWNSSIASAVKQIQLRPLDNAALYSVFKEVCSFYQQAYGFKCDELALEGIFERVLKRTAQDVIRMKIKGFVEALDLLRHNPGRPVHEVLGSASAPAVAVVPAGLIAMSNGKFCKKLSNGRYCTISLTGAVQSPPRDTIEE